jgi:hypothetical protein
MAKTVGSVQADAGLKAGAAGTLITRIVKGSFTLDAADLATVTAADESVTIAGAAAGDIVIINPPTTALTAGMLVCNAHVSAANTVKIRLYNSSGGSINLASGTWYYTLIKS